jgi:hypothetical protein
MLKFTHTRLHDGQLTAAGPFSGDSALQVKHLRFLIAQGEEMVEDDAEVDGSGWTGETSAEGLRPGPAQGFGLAVMLRSGSPPSFETFTWLEAVTLEG